MANKPSSPGGPRISWIFGLLPYSSEPKIADKRPRDESVDYEYERDDRDDATAQLCSRCKGLGLTVEHFIIEPAKEETPRHFGRYSANLGSTNSNFSLRTGRSPEVFATLNDLKSERDSCGFCDLASRAIERYGRRNLAATTPCSLTWQVDGRAGPEDPGYGEGRFRKAVNKTRRLKLSWGEDESEGQVYLVLAVARARLMLPWV